MGLYLHFWLLLIINPLYVELLHTCYKTPSSSHLKISKPKSFSNKYVYEPRTYYRNCIVYYETMEIKPLSVMVYVKVLESNVDYEIPLGLLLMEVKRNRIAYNYFNKGPDTLGNFLGNVSQLLHCCETSCTRHCLV